MVAWVGVPDIICDLKPNFRFNAKFNYHQSSIDKRAELCMGMLRVPQAFVPRNRVQFPIFRGSRCLWAEISKRQQNARGSSKVIDRFPRVRIFAF